PSTPSLRPPPARGYSCTPTAVAAASRTTQATPTPAPSPAGPASSNAAAPDPATSPRHSFPKPSAPLSPPATSLFDPDSCSSDSTPELRRKQPSSTQSKPPARPSRSSISLRPRPAAHSLPLPTSKPNSPPAPAGCAL